MATPPSSADPSLLSLKNLPLLGSITLGHSVVHWFAQAFPVLLAEISLALGLSPLAAGTVMGARSIMGAVVNIPMGAASDRFASWRALFMTASIVWFGGAFFLIPLAPNYVVLVLFVSTLGIGVALWHPPAMGLLSTRFAERRASAIAIHGVGASLGDITGPLFIGALIAALSWQSAMRSTLLPALALAGVFWLVVRSGARQAAPRGHMSMRDYGAALRSAAKHRPLLLVLLSSGVRNGGQLILVTFIPIYAREQLGLSPALVGGLAALLLGASIVTQPLLGYVSDRTSRKAVVLPGLFVLTVATPFLALANNAALLVTLVSIVGLFLFSMATLQSAMSLDIAPPELQSTTAAAQFVVGLGFGSWAPITAGALAGATFFDSVFYLAAAMFFVATLIVIPIRSAPAGKTGSWLPGG